MRDSTPSPPPARQRNLRNLAEAFAAQTHYATLALDLALARSRPSGPAVIDTDVACFQRIFDSADLGRGGSVTLHHLQASSA